MTESMKPSRGFTKRLSRLARRVGTGVWILICVGCWGLAVGSMWRAFVLSSNTFIKYEFDTYSQNTFQIYSNCGLIEFEKWSPSRLEDEQVVVVVVKEGWRFYSAPSNGFAPVRLSRLSSDILTSYRSLPGWLVPRFRRHEQIYQGETHLSLPVEIRQTENFWGVSPHRFQIHTDLRIPWWLILTILHSPLPFILRARRRRFRRQNNLCLKCGYDIRASTKQCSECGAVIE